MRQFCATLLILLVCSCEYFNVKKTTPEAILEEDLRTFNWDDVDTYPSFRGCDSLLLKEEKKACFESTLYSEINEYLQSQKIVVTQHINDTVLLKLRVSKNGQLSLLDAKIDSLTKQEIPEIEEIILKGIEALPEIKSAIKKAQPVRTEFELPLIIKVN